MFSVVCMQHSYKASISYKFDDGECSFSLTRYQSPRGSGLRFFQERVSCHVSLTWAPSFRKKAMSTRAWPLLELVMILTTNTWCSLHQRRSIYTRLSASPTTHERSNIRSNINYPRIRLEAVLGSRTVAASSDSRPLLEAVLEVQIYLLLIRLKLVRLLLSDSKYVQLKLWPFSSCTFDTKWNSFLLYS